MENLKAEKVFKKRKKELEGKKDIENNLKKE